ncbi:hypothetical protein ABGB18_07490 [Nonomuraea sp. B12E4]|uniref:hypothetical protein n=1 Tax=Nonomuraea sp. B12E4 TaxID=3153564 RepID=UPI00325DC3E8
MILVRGGTYAPTTNLQILKDGTPQSPITLTAYGREKVVIDGEALPHTPAPVDAGIRNSQRGVIHMEAAHWRIAGLELASSFLRPRNGADVGARL